MGALREFLSRLFGRRTADEPGRSRYPGDRRSFTTRVVDVDDLPEPVPGAALDDHVASIVGVEPRFDPAGDPEVAQASVDAHGHQLEIQHRRQALQVLQERLADLPKKRYVIAGAVVAGAVELASSLWIFTDLGLEAPLNLVAAATILVVTVYLVRVAARQAKRVWVVAASCAFFVVTLAAGVVREAEIGSGDGEDTLFRLAMTVLCAAGIAGPPLVIHLLFTKWREITTLENKIENEEALVAALEATQAQARALIQARYDAVAEFTAWKALVAASVRAQHPDYFRLKPGDDGLGEGGGSSHEPNESS